MRGGDRAAEVAVGVTPAWFDALLDGGLHRFGAMVTRMEEKICGG